MVPIDSFIEALKITWLRRYILQEHCTWSILSNFDIFSTAKAYLCVIDAKHFLNDPHFNKNAIVSIVLIP